MEEITACLVQKVQEGDDAAYTKLVSLYQDWVRRICYRMTGNEDEAEELTQETFIRVFLHIDRFDRSRRFSSWIYRIATNVTIDYLRKKRFECSLDAQIDGMNGKTLYCRLATADPLPEHRLIVKEQAVFIQEAVSGLAPKYRTAIILKYFDDLSIKEISRLLNVPQDTVKTRIFRGRKKLRRQLQKG